MKTVLTILVCMVLGTELCPAQTLYSGRIYKKPEHIVESHQMGPCIIADSTAIDTVVLLVDYRYERSLGNRPTSMTIRLEKGRYWVKQTDLRMYYNGLHRAVFHGLLKGIKEDAFNKELIYNRYPSDLFLETLYNPKDDIMTIICSDFFTNNQPRTYQEQRPRIEWTLTEKTDSVCGYACNAAEANFRGRIWTVWYAPEIPLGLGPWKLSGLPGLILKAETEGFRFECAALRQPENKPIYRNTYKGMQNFKTREAYMRYERRSFEHPLETANLDQNMFFMIQTPQGTYTELDNSWSIPYNPLERE